MWLAVCPQRCVDDKFIEIWMYLLWADGWIQLNEAIKGNLAVNRLSVCVNSIYYGRPHSATIWLPVVKLGGQWPLVAKLVDHLAECTQTIIRMLAEAHYWLYDLSVFMTAPKLECTTNFFRSSCSGPRNMWGLPHVATATVPCR